MIRPAEYSFRWKGTDADERLLTGIVHPPATHHLHVRPRAIRAAADRTSIPCVHLETQATREATQQDSRATRGVAHGVRVDAIMGQGSTSCPFLVARRDESEVAESGSGQTRPVSLEGGPEESGQRLAPFAAQEADQIDAHNHLSIDETGQTDRLCTLTTEDMRAKN